MIFTQASTKRRNRGSGSENYASSSLLACKQEDILNIFIN